MLITFKSRAAADVIMFGEVGQKMLAVMGKDAPDARGIVTVEQLPGAIARLRAAIEQDKQARSGGPATADEEDTPRGMTASVNFTQRAVPLLELLEYSLREETPVTWES